MIVFKDNGDLLGSDMHVLTNPVNCLGAMGRGLARQFRDGYPDMYQDYLRRCQIADLEIGRPYLYIDEKKWILNFPTKRHWRDASNINWIADGLHYLVAYAQTWSIPSLAMPALGCGNGHLQWHDVKPVMVSILEQLKIPIEIYESLGTEEYDRER